MKSKLSIFILSLLLLTTGCNDSPEEKAKKLVGEELKTTLNDYKSYESVKWGKLDSAFTEILDDSVYKSVTEDFQKNIDECKKNQELAKIYVNLSTLRNYYVLYSTLANEYLAKAKINQVSLDSIMTAYRPRYSGWKIEHSFRAKSLGGNLGIHHYMYYLNDSITKISKDVDITAK